MRASPKAKLISDIEDPKTVQIVIAWLDDAQELVRAGRIDLGERHVFRSVKTSRAAMWINNGTDADRRKAEAYAAANGASVLTYDNVADPLGQARADILHPPAERACSPA